MYAGITILKFYDEKREVLQFNAVDKNRDKLCNWRQLTAGHKILSRLPDKREQLVIDVTSILAHWHMSQSYALSLSRALIWNSSHVIGLIYVQF